MKHTLKISLSKEAQFDGIVSCRRVSIREKILRMLLGDKRQLMVIIPGDSVKVLSIVEEGGEYGEQSPVSI